MNNYKRFQFQIGLDCNSAAPQMMLKIHRTADSADSHSADSHSAAAAAADNQRHQDTADSHSHSHLDYCRIAAGTNQGLAAADSAVEDSIDCSSSL